MNINSNGQLTKEPITLITIPKAQPILDKTKEIMSFFIDNSIKTPHGYIFRPDVHLMKKLIKHLKKITLL